MEGESLDTVLTVAVPASVGLGLVALTVLVIFWLGTSRQASYEEAVKARQGQVEKEMRKQAEKEKEQQKQKREKKRGGERRRRQPDATRPGGQEETPQLPPAQKSILKSSKPNSVVREKVDPSVPNRVDFELSATPAKTGKPSRANPPTPHPSAQRSSLAPRLLVKTQEEAEEEGVPTREPRVDPQRKSEEQPKPKPVAAALATPTKASTGFPRGPKKAKKTRPAVEPGTMEALPASRIFDIVNSSSLSDDDIQHLIDQLLQMMNANAEWRGTSKGTESVKTLKKANEDLHTRCKEAEKTVQNHFSKIRELRGEIKQEQARRQVSENQLQGMINKQSSEIIIFKSKISGLEEELKQTRQLSSTHALKKLEEENSALSLRVTTLAQENSTLTGQLTARNKSLQEAQEQATKAVADLRRTKSAAKSPTGEGRAQLERVTELEGRLRQVEEDNASLQSALKSTEVEKDRLAEQVQSLASLTRERDGLTQQLSSVEQELHDAQVSVQGLEKRGAEADEEGEKLRGEIQQLREENSLLGTQVTTLQQQSTQAVAEVAALQQQQPQGPSQDQLEAMKSQLETAHADERQALVAKLEAEKATEVEKTKTELQTALAGEQRAVVAKMEADRTSEVMGLKAQYEAELHSVKEELMHVRRAGEEEKSRVEQQLASETARKQELQSELETLKTTAVSSQQNGPVEDQVDSHHEEVLQAKEEELARSLEERDELKGKLKSAESKLNDLQGKNNTLRDNCWKARDDTANMQKASEAKLRQVYKETEGHVKAAEVRVRGEVEEGQRALLERLFPDVSVEDETSYPVWVDQFETQAQLTIENTKKQLCMLTERVEELEENEQAYIQEAQGFRDTLNVTLGNLAKLQAEVTRESVKHVRLLEERDEMLQRERVTNRDLQQQLSKEKEATANLQAELKKAGVGDEERKERVRELEERLEESAQQRETLAEEVDRLTASVEQVTEHKTKADETIDQLKNRCEELEKKLKETEQQSLQSSVELEKIGQSIMQIPTDSTEV